MDAIAIFGCGVLVGASVASLLWLLWIYRELDL
jgi:hypothetical protein